MAKDSRIERPEGDGGRNKAGMRIDPDLARELRGASDDLVGGGDWRSSKVGYLSGFSAVKSGLKVVGSGVGSAVTQVGSFYRAMFGRDDAALEPIAVDDPAARFVRAMRVYGKSVADLDRIQNATFRGAVLFGAMMLVAVACGLGSYWWSPARGASMLFDFTYRFLAVAPLAGFALRNSYTNWMVRRRRFDGLFAYLSSGELAPKRARRAAGPPAKAAKTKALPPGGAGKAASRAVKRAVVAMFVAASLLAMPLPQVSAQTSTPPQATAGGTGMTPPTSIFVTPGPQDVFMNMLSMIAPGVGPIPGTATPAHQAMAAGFAAFISALFFLAGMQVAWHTVSGIVATAQEGKVLGQRWHEVWAPIRVVSGVGFLAPAVNGFCVAQVVVLYLIAWGGSLANLIWVPYVTQMTSGVATSNASTSAAVSSTITQLANTNEILENVFEKELCYATIKQSYNRRGLVGMTPPSSILPPTVSWQPSYTYTQPYDNESSMWTALTTATPANTTTAPPAPGQNATISGQTLDYGSICGKIIVPVTTTAGGTPPPEFAAAATFSQAQQNAIDSGSGGIRAALQQYAQQAAQSYQNYQAASSGGTNGLFFSAEASGPQPGNAGAGTVAALKSAFQTARANYETAMMTAAQNMIAQNGLGTAAMTSNGGTATNQASGSNNLQQFVQNATQGGWATAGVYYMSISRIQAAVFAQAGKKPDIVAVDLSQADPWLKTALVGKQGVAGPLPDFWTWAQSNVAQLSTDAANNAINPYGPRGGSSNSSVVTEVFNKLMLPSVGTLLSKFQPSPFNPLGDIMTVGHYIIDSGWAMLVAIAGVAAVTKAATGNWLSSLATMGAAGAATAAIWSLVSPLILVILMSVFAMGITMAFIIPMVPYIMVLFFIIGMLVLTLEAMIAAPLWAFFHVRMDGADLIDQVQRPGYMIAFNLLLRPALMMLGYIMSFFAFGAVCWFITTTFSSAVTAATAGYLGGPITFLVMGGMMAYLYYQAAMRCFTMIVQVPDRVTRWFGVGGENLGEENQAHGASGMVVGAVTDRSERTLGPAVGNALASGGPNGSRNGGGGGGNPSGNPVVTQEKANTTTADPGGSLAAPGAAVDAARQAAEPNSDIPSGSPSGSAAGSDVGSGAVVDKQTPNSPTGDAGPDGEGSEGPDGGGPDGGTPGGRGGGGGGGQGGGYAAPKGTSTTAAPPNKAGGQPSGNYNADPANQRNPGSASQIGKRQ